MFADFSNHPLERLERGLEESLWSSVEPSDRISFFCYNGVMTWLHEGSKQEWVAVLAECPSLITAHWERVSRWQQVTFGCFSSHASVLFYIILTPEFEEVFTHRLWSRSCFLRSLHSHSWFLKWFKMSSSRKETSHKTCLCIYQNVVNNPGHTTVSQPITWGFSYRLTEQSHIEDKVLRDQMNDVCYQCKFHQNEHLVPKITWNPFKA